MNFKLCCEIGEKCGVPCSEEEFTCANGCCLDAGLDCDKEEQCSDGSDEKNCEHCECTRCKPGFVSIIDHSHIQILMSGLDLSFGHKRKVSSCVHANKCFPPLTNSNGLPSLESVKDKFETLLQIPVDEKKGNFLLLLVILPFMVK